MDGGPSHTTTIVPMNLDYRRRLLLSYALDWTIAIVIFLFSKFVLGRLQNISDFDLNDTSIQLPLMGSEYVPSILLIIICFVAYPLIVAGNLLYLGKGAVWDVHVAFLALSMTYAAAQLLASLTHLAVGRPRPGCFWARISLNLISVSDFLARCNPVSNATNAEVSGLATIAVCQSEFTLVRDGMSSFISEHAILSAGGLGFLSLYWAGKLRVFSRRPSCTTVNFGLVSIPLALSLVFSATRIIDHRNHWDDVVVAYLVGLSIAYISYRRFFPPLGHPQSHLPYPPRIEPDEETDFLLIKTVSPFYLDDLQPQFQPSSRNMQSPRRDSGQFSLPATPLDNSIQSPRRHSVLFLHPPTPLDDEFPSDEGTGKKDF
ncbi:hypothetical protein C8J56DRAFT_863810 [Mycena floridula]|nr:hypothetical protein C8J56DRAFT_863810 [Mycena floridula]